MRPLSDTLRSAQQSESVVPAVKLTGSNRTAGALRLDWHRLYSGSEPAGPHAAAMPSDGSLVRCRIAPAGQTLLYQRTASPGPASDFNQWVSTGLYGATAAACCALNDEVSIFWIDSTRKLQRLNSTDCGASWGSPELLDYTPSTAAGGLAAAYKPDGCLAVFFTDQQTLYVKRFSGSWQSCAPWNKSTGILTGAACIYAADWCLLVTGQDAGGNSALWSIVYGDGGEAAAGTWSDLNEVASAPASGDFEFNHPALDAADIVRCFYTESFTGIESYARPYRNHMLDSGFTENLWREPSPFNYNGSSGLSLTHHGSDAWLSCPDGVWRASLEETETDLSGDILNLKTELTEFSSKLVVELKNDEGHYTYSGGFLDAGGRLELGLGFRTAAGIEFSEGPSFFTGAIELVSSPGKASMIINGGGGWEILQNWTARYQLRWNKSRSDAAVLLIIEAVLARAGLSLEVISASSAASGYYPDFTIQPGETGDSAVKKLLSFIPDVLFFEGDKGCLLNPDPGELPVYNLGSGNVIKDARFRNEMPDVSAIRIEGYDGASGEPLLCDIFDWAGIDKDCGTAVTLSDRNLSSTGQAIERGSAYLRKVQMRSIRGMVRTPVNCAQQLYDVVAVTDRAAGLDNEPMRVLGITFIYNPGRGEYEQRLMLGSK